MSAEFRQVGVTGGIGAGKSTVCKVFSLLGIPVYDADRRARELMSGDRIVLEKLRNLFGDRAFLADGRPDRTYIASVVFSDSGLLDQLNSIVHPAVGKDYVAWLSMQQGVPYVIKEAALLIESGSYRQLQVLITVTAPQEERIRRVLLRDGHRSPAQVRDILARQMPEAEKTAVSDFIIRNDNQSLILPQILKIHANLIR